MGFIVTLMFFVGGGLLLGARSRITRLEHRLRLVEEELRRRIAAGFMPLADSVPCPPSELVEPEQAPEPELQSELMQEPEPAPDIQPGIESVADTGWSVPPSHMVSPPPPELQPTPEPEIADSLERDDEPEHEPATAPRGASMNFEELFGRKLPIWAGGITLAIAGVLIVKYAIDQGIFGRIFTPGVQAICGALFGLGLICGAEWAWRKREQVADPRVSQALSGAGISTLYAALLVAANLYDLISSLTAFLGLALVTGGALWLSLRHGMPSALLGLAGGLAAPALTVGLDANVPMLAVYLGFTIAGLAGVSRVRRWPWLAMIALIGGAGWSLWLIVAGKALGLVGALSVGGFVLLLALLLPLFVFTEAAQRFLRAIAAIVGAAQFGLLVALGGFQPLHWGLFALIAAAGQFLSWRERDFAIVPTIGAALSFILLMLWNEPDPAWLLGIGLALGAIHAGPLLALMWQSPARLQRAVELSGIAFAAPALALRHMHHTWGGSDPVASAASLGGGLLVLAGAALGWKNTDRPDDNRFALLLASGGLLLTLAFWFGLPHWQAPLWSMAVALGLLFFAPHSGDRRIEPLAAGFGGLSLVLLMETLVPGRLGELAVMVGASDTRPDAISLLRWSGLAFGFMLFAWRAGNPALRYAAYTLTSALAYGVAAQQLPEWILPIALGAISAALLTVLQAREVSGSERLALPFGAGAIALLAISGSHPAVEWLRLVGEGDGMLNGTAFARWGAVALLGTLYAARARFPAVRFSGEAGAALFGYGALAQIVPQIALPLVPPLGLLVLALWCRSQERRLLVLPGAVLELLVIGWAFSPMIAWLDLAIRSLAGSPMQFDNAELTLFIILRRLAAPAILAGISAWALHERAPRRAFAALIGITGALGLTALHSLYRHGFAALFGMDFVATGLAQRLVWAGMLLGVGGLIYKRLPQTRIAQAVGSVLGAAAGFHTLWYSLILHNPLWSAQHVGAMPLLNLLVPLFVLLPLSLHLLERAQADLAEPVAKVMQPVLMAMVAAFAWATLRQAFHGTLLVDPGVSDAEDILRSILGIVLAISFLLWGIRRKLHSWRIASLVLMLAAVAKVFLLDASGLEGLLRIASFIALGFSLIGIGWLYSRQLRSDHD